MPNVNLAQRILDQVTANPDSLDMSNWFGSTDDAAWDINEIPAGSPLSCDTTMCIAGWAGHFTGYSLLSNAGQVLAVKDGRAHAIEDMARDELGITDLRLFHADETTAIAALKQLAAGEELDMDAARLASFT